MPWWKAVGVPRVAIPIKRPRKARSRKRSPHISCTLTDKAEDNGKLNIDRNGKKWSNTTRRVEGFGRLMLLPEFGGMTLVQLSNSRQLVHDWHRRMIRKHGVASANLAARCLGTIYERERELSDLPDMSPILAVHWARENWKDDDNEGGLEPATFRHRADARSKRR